MNEQYIVRFPDGMRHLIKERAVKNRRTMNAEIIYCIEQQLEAEKEKGVKVAAGEQIGVQAPAANNQHDVSASHQSITTER